MIAFSPETIKRFWSRVQKTDSCWLWIAGKTRSGYVSFRASNRALFAHRISWVLVHGRIPSGMCVCHMCDIPACVNPEHLFLGTHAENMRDAANKNRFPKGEQHHAHRSPEVMRPPLGERNGNAKLRDEWIPFIRKRLAEGESQRSIAADYGVSHGMIGRISRGTAWRHVEGRPNLGEVIMEATK